MPSRRRCFVTSFGLKVIPKSKDGSRKLEFSLLGPISFHDSGRKVVSWYTISIIISYDIQKRLISTWMSRSMDNLCLPKHNPSQLPSSLSRLPNFGYQLWDHIEVQAVLKCAARRSSKTDACVTEVNVQLPSLLRIWKSLSSLLLMCSSPSTFFKKKWLFLFDCCAKVDWYQTSCCNCQMWRTDEGDEGFNVMMSRWQGVT